MTVSQKDARDHMKKEKITFEQAKNYLKPTPLFRIVNLLYAERKLLVVLLVHLMATLIIWGKHAEPVRWSSL
jgi:hypothetical protein